MSDQSSPPPLEPFTTHSHTDFSTLFPTLQPTNTVTLPAYSIVQPDFIVISERDKQIKTQLEQLKQERQRQKQQLQHTNDIIDLTDTHDIIVEPKKTFHNSAADEFMSIAEYAEPNRVTRPKPTPSIPHTTQSTQQPSQCTWLKQNYTQNNAILRLHEEIIDFCAYVSPTTTEHAIRVDCIQRLTQLVHSTFDSSVRVETFGSFATQLYLPISDIDVCIFGAKSIQYNNQSTFNILADAIKLSGFASYIELVAKARIPIIKIVDKQTNIKIDISFEIQGGIDAVQYLNTQLATYSAMRPLILLLKYFLYCRNLNETYSGGIGSFVLQMIVLNFLELHPQQHNTKIDGTQLNLGILLISFLELYGKQFNYYTVGINVHNTGQYYSKHKYNRYNVERPHLLSIENPLDAAHDISGNSYQILKIRRAFYYAYIRLITQLQYNTTTTRYSMLSSVLSLDPDMYVLRPKLDFKSMSDGTSVFDTPIERPNKRVKLNNDMNGDSSNNVIAIDTDNDTVISTKSNHTNTTTNGIKSDVLANNEDFVSLNTNNTADNNFNNGLHTVHTAIKNKKQSKKKKTNLDSLFHGNIGGNNAKHSPNSQAKTSKQKLKQKRRNRHLKNVEKLKSRKERLGF